MKKIRKHLHKHNHYDMHLIFTQIAISAVALPLSFFCIYYLENQVLRESLFILIALVYGISSLLLFARVLQVCYNFVRDFRISGAKLMFIFLAFLTFYTTYWMIMFADKILLS